MSCDALPLSVYRCRTRSWPFMEAHSAGLCETTADNEQHQLIHTTAKKHFTDQQLISPQFLRSTVKRDSSYYLNNKQPINSLHPDPLQPARLLIKTGASLKGFTFISSELSFLISLMLAPSPRNGFCLAAP